MWLMTKHGFFSIVKKKKGEFHVRAREHMDLENLINGIPFKGKAIIDTPDADYAHRIIATQEDVQAIMSFLGETLDYSNFKGKIDKTPDQQHKPYHKVWQVMADALGAYGSKGKAL